jgi:hypothetical protein
MKLNTMKGFCLIGLIRNDNVSMCQNTLIEMVFRGFGIINLIVNQP